MKLLYILFALLIFGFLIFIHELGHYLFARLFKVSINEFSIGMGPKIFSKKSKKTGILYSLRLLPIGGYVSMEGEDGESQDENAFQKKAPWKRLIILAAGGTTNILAGFLAMFFLVCATSGSLGSTTVAEFLPPEGETAALSETSGLKAGDQILRVGHVSVHTANELVYEIMSQGYEPLTLTVRRDGEKTVLEDVRFPTLTEAGAVFGDADFRVYAEEGTFSNILKHSFFRSFSTVKMIWDSLFDLVGGRYGVEAISGPVGVTQVISEAAEKREAANLVYLAIVIAVNLGVVNLLPLPALDGGRIVFVLIEMIFRKPVDRKIEGYIHAAGLIVLLILIALVTVKDVIGLF